MKKSTSIIVKLSKAEKWKKQSTPEEEALLKK